MTTLFLLFLFGGFCFGLGFYDGRQRESLKRDEQYTNVLTWGRAQRAEVRRLESALERRVDEVAELNDIIETQDAHNRMVLKLALEQPTSRRLRLFAMAAGVIEPNAADDAEAAHVYEVARRAIFGDAFCDANPSDRQQLPEHADGKKGDAS